MSLSWAGQHFRSYFKAFTYCLSINTNCGYEISKIGIDNKKKEKILAGQRKKEAAAARMGKYECLWIKNEDPFPLLRHFSNPKGPSLLPLPIWANTRKLSPPDFSFVKQSHRWPRGWLLCINFANVCGSHDLFLWTGGRSGNGVESGIYYKDPLKLYMNTELVLFLDRNYIAQGYCC